MDRAEPPEGRTRVAVVGRSALIPGDLQHRYALFTCTGSRHPVWRRLIWHRFGQEKVRRCCPAVLPTAPSSFSLFLTAWRRRAHLRANNARCLDLKLVKQNFSSALASSPLENDRQCGVYNSAFGGQWQSLSCEAALPYICKKTPNISAGAEPIGESRSTYGRRTGVITDHTTNQPPPDVLLTAAADFVLF